MKPPPIKQAADSSAWQAHLANRPRKSTPAQVKASSPARPANSAVKVPSVARQARNVTAAWLKWSAAGCPKRSREEVQRIAALCETCVYGGDRHPVFRYKRCKKCGCSRIKLGWATERCPVGKW